MQIRTDLHHVHCKYQPTVHNETWTDYLICGLRQARILIVRSFQIGNCDQRSIHRFLVLFCLTMGAFVMLFFLRGTERSSGPFPMLNDTEPTEEFQSIPFRIHQMYKDENIPSVYGPFVKSWIKHHPSWEYWFWTDASIRNLLQDQYPQFLDMYDSYSNNLLRSDAARYFILYHFGGVYADMDMESFQPVEPILQKHSCIFSREPTIQSTLLYDMTSVTMNAWMACSQKHKFMKYVINYLPPYANLPIKNIFETIHITGPQMLHQTLLRYNKTQNCTHGAPGCSVYLAPYEMFMPAWDDGQRGHFREMCSINLSNLSLKQLLACQWLRKIDFTNTIPSKKPYIYANHKFLHIGYENGRYKNRKPIHITQLVPHALRYVRRHANSTGDYEIW